VEFCTQVRGSTCRATFVDIVAFLPWVLPCGCRRLVYVYVCLGNKCLLGHQVCSEVLTQIHFIDRRRRTNQLSSTMLRLINFLRCNNFLASVNTKKIKITWGRGTNYKRWFDPLCLSHCTLVQPISFEIAPFFTTTCLNLKRSRRQAPCLQKSQVHLVPSAQHIVLVSRTQSLPRLRPTLNPR